MLTTIIKRLLQGVLVIFLVLTATFFLLRMIPGDPARMIMGNADESAVQELREEMGLTKPVLVQYKDYMLSLITGDMGHSYFAKNDVADVIAASWKPTMVMIALALPSAIIIGLILGILCAITRGSLFDRVLSAIAVLFQSMPNYWVAIMLIQIVGVKLGWFPTTGYKNVSYAVLPAVVLGLPLAGVFARSVRTNLIGAMNQDFAKAAKARGVPWLKVLMGYSFRDILVSFLTLVASQLGFMMGNCLLIENIFGYPGIGLQTLNAILRRDYFLVQGMVALLAAVFIIINTVVDISYLYLDPRIRKAQGGL